MIKAQLLDSLAKILGASVDIVECESYFNWANLYFFEWDSRRYQLIVASTNTVNPLLDRWQLECKRWQMKSESSNIYYFGKCNDLKWLAFELESIKENLIDSSLLESSPKESFAQLWPKSWRSAICRQFIRNKLTALDSPIIGLAQLKLGLNWVFPLPLQRAVDDILCQNEINISLDILNNIDQCISGIEVYEEITSELIDAWDALYKSSNAVYSLSPHWCKAWMDNFSEGSGWKIWTVWDNEELVALAPLFESDFGLSLIGTVPALLDQGDFLYKNENVLNDLLDHLILNGTQLHLLFLSSEGALLKGLQRKYYQQGLHYESELIDAMPFLTPSWVESKKQRDDFKRCENRIKQAFGDAPQFEESVDLSPENIEEMIEIHKVRWNGGPFADLKRMRSFLHQLANCPQLILLSRVKVGESSVLAYHLAYRNANGSLSSSIPAYNTTFSEYSPGKILLYQIVKMVRAQEIGFDFGRGAEVYKYWFSDQSKLLVHFKSLSSKPWKIFMRRVLGKILRIIQ